VTICVVLDPKKSSTYSSEYASGFSGPAASHLAAPPSPRHEGNAEQAPSVDYLLVPEVVLVPFVKKFKRHKVERLPEFSRLDDLMT
jgi:hypothetical protein